MKTVLLIAALGMAGWKSDAQRVHAADVCQFEGGSARYRWNGDYLDCQFPPKGAKAP